MFGISFSISSPYFYCVESLLYCDWVMEKNKRGKTCSMQGKITHVHGFGEEENFSGRDVGMDWTCLGLS